MKKGERKEVDHLSEKAKERKKQRKNNSKVEIEISNSTTPPKSLKRKNFNNKKPRKDDPNKVRADVFISNRDWGAIRDKIIKKTYKTLSNKDYNDKTLNDIVNDVKSDLIANTEFLINLRSTQLNVVDKIIKVIYLLVNRKDIEIKEIISLANSSYGYVKLITETLGIKHSSQQRDSKHFTNAEVSKWIRIYKRIGSVYGVNNYLKNSLKIYPSEETINRRITKLLLEQGDDPEDFFEKYRDLHLTLNDEELVYVLEQFYHYIQDLEMSGYSKEEIFNDLFIKKKINIVIKQLVKNSDISYLLYNKRVKKTLKRSLVILGFSLLKYTNYKQLSVALKNFTECNSRAEIALQIKRTMKAFKSFSGVKIKDWLPDALPENVKSEEVDYWVDLLKEVRNIEMVREILENSEIFPKRTAKTIKSYIINRIGKKKYKELVSKKTIYPELEKLAKKIGIEQTGYIGKIVTLKDEFEKLKEPNTKELIWECGKCGQRFKKTAKEVKRGNWCNECAMDKFSLTSRTSYEEILEVIRDVSLKKCGIEGKFLMSEEEYYGLKRVYRFKFPVKCGKCGFEWKVLLDNLKKASWCPECSAGYMERVCRILTEKILSYHYGKDIELPTTMLSSIIHNINIESQSSIERDAINNLLSSGHVDGYNFELNLGLEVNGEQHYLYIPYFHSNYRDFEYRRLLDKLKVKLLKKNHIKLIIIPYYEFNDDIQEFIVEQIEHLLDINIRNIPKFILNSYKENDQKLIEDYY